MRRDFRARSHPAWWAFLVHRLSGLALAAFLPLHFWALGQALHGEAALDAFLLGGFSEFCSLDSTEPVEVTAATITTPNGRLPALVANVHISASIGR